MRDILNRKDIELVMEQFYQSALADVEIGYLFTEIAHLDLTKHLPLICDFWELVILKNGNYKNDVMAIHLNLHSKSPLKATHFKRWLELFTGTLNASFKGTNTELMKMRAQSIATMMQVKIYNQDS